MADDETATDPTDDADDEDAIIPAPPDAAPPDDPPDEPIVNGALNPVDIVRGQGSTDVLLDESNADKARAAMAAGTAVLIRGLEGPHMVERMRGRGMIVVAEVTSRKG